MYKTKKITQESVQKFIDEARLDTPVRARNAQEYEVMLMDFIRKQVEDVE